MFQSTFKAIVLTIALALSPHLKAATSIAVSKTPLSLPLIVAQEKGFYQQAGIEPTIVECVGGFRCLSLMLKGQTNYATCSELPIVFTSFDRKDFVLLSSFVSNTQDMKLIVRESLRNDFPSSLQGKKVGIVANSASHYYFDVVLSLYGLDPKAVTLNAMAPGKLGDALKNKEVDAISIWEPFGYTITQEMSDSVAVIPDLSIFNQTFNLVGNMDHVQANQDESQKILTALLKANEFIKNNPDEAKTILRNWLDLDKEFVEYSFPAHTYELSIRQSIVTSMLSQRKWAESAGKAASLTTQFSIFEIIDTRPLRVVSPASIDLVGD